MKVSRKVYIEGKGDFVVTISQDGVSIRMFRKRKRVKLSFEELAKLGLEQAAYLLTSEEWKDPLRTLGNLGRLKQR